MVNVGWALDGNERNMVIFIFIFIFIGSPTFFLSCLRS